MKSVYDVDQGDATVSESAQLFWLFSSVNFYLTVCRCRATRTFSFSQPGPQDLESMFDIFVETVRTYRQKQPALRVKDMLLRHYPSKPTERIRPKKVLILGSGGQINIVLVQWFPTIFDAFLPLLIFIPSLFGFAGCQLQLEQRSLLTTMT